MTNFTTLFLLRGTVESGLICCSNCLTTGSGCPDNCSAKTRVWANTNFFWFLASKHPAWKWHPLSCLLPGECSTMLAFTSSRIFSISARRLKALNSSRSDFDKAALLLAFSPFSNPFLLFLLRRRRAGVGRVARRRLAALPLLFGPLPTFFVMLTGFYPENKLTVLSDSC